MIKLPICNTEGQAIGEHKLSDDLLSTKQGAQAVVETITAIRANQRAGTASTKTKGEVAGSGKKPWRQKGTGRARAGYRQSPIWRGGGVVFGPKPRSYAKDINKKVGRLAFRRAFTERVTAGDVIVLDQFSLPEAKTKHVAALLKKLNANGSVLLVLDQVGRDVALATRNVAKLEVAAANYVNVVQLLRPKKVLISKEALIKLEERLRA